MNPPKDNLLEWLRRDPIGFWREFKETGDQEMRNCLIESFLHLVNYHAERLGAKLHDKLDLDDLKQVGVFGLIQAIEAYDPLRKIKFETYCAMRIRGAILDDLRSHDWVPRLIRQRSKQLEKAYRALEEKLSRPPHDKEMAEHLGMTLEEYYELARDASAVSVLSLNGKDSDENSTSGLGDLSDKKASNPAKKLEKKDLIQNMLAELNDEEKKVLMLYYYEELTMKEIGKVLELSESRISQIHSGLLNRLRFKYGKDVKSFAA